MNIKEKLKFLDQINKPEKRNYQPRELTHPIDQVIDGEIFLSSYGESFVRTTKFNIKENHGSVNLNQIDEIAPYFLKLAGKDENLIDIDLRKSLFFDTETTGLAGGSGTHIFLAGFGFFEKERFILKQFFLRDFPEELTMLHKINELLAQFDSLVSFNGKSYDLPLLKSRFTLNRIKHNFSRMPHLDLLHASRRIWKNRLPDCTLNTLERIILGVFRDGDVPSNLIPAMYFEYLRTKDARPLKKIFYHNEIDILSLVSLTIVLHQIHKSPLEQLSHKTDLLTLAKHYENMNHWEQSIPIYQRLINTETNLSEKKEMGILLGYIYKRTGKIEKAVQLWSELIEEGNFRIEPYEELAKYYEHRISDLKKAEQIVIEALKNLELIEELGGADFTTQYKDSMTYRFERIKRNLNR